MAFDYKTALVEAGVPGEYHEEAIKSLEESKKLFYPGIFWRKLAAPFVTALFCPFLKWEDNKVPKFFEKWDNNISMNGDATNWRWTTIDGVTFPRRAEAPLDKNEKLNDAGNQLCYYRKGDRHVRENMSRYLFIGTRNPAGGYARMLGPKVSKLVFINEVGETKFAIQSWGDDKPGRKSLGLRVLKLGDHWQIIRFAKWKTIKIGKKTFDFGLDSNWGYKINNIASDYDALDPESQLCVCHTSVPFKLK